jgi:hypothetical protein
VSCETPPFPNIAHGLPPDIAEELGSGEAASKAVKMQASQLKHPLIL